MTESGKTTLASELSRYYRERGIGVLVLDPLGDPRWSADVLLSDRHEFLELCRTSRRCMIFVDEAGESVGQYDNEMHWLATRGRHYGHCAHFCSQRGMQIAKTVRDQCSLMWLFRSSISDCKIHADEWGFEELRAGNSLAQGEYFYAERFGALERCRLNWSKSTVENDEVNDDAPISSDNRDSGGRGTPGPPDDEEPGKWAET